MGKDFLYCSHILAFSLTYSTLKVIKLGFYFLSIFTTLCRDRDKFTFKFNPHQHGYKNSHIGTTRVNFDLVYIFCQIKSKCVQHPHSCYLFVFLHNFRHIHRAALITQQSFVAKLTLKYQIDFPAISTVYWMNISQSICKFL